MSKTLSDLTYKELHQYLSFLNLDLSEQENAENGARAIQKLVVNELRLRSTFVKDEECRKSLEEHLKLKFAEKFRLLARFEIKQHCSRTDVRRTTWVVNTTVFNCPPDTQESFKRHECSNFIYEIMENYGIFVQEIKFSDSSEGRAQSDD